MSGKSYEDIKNRYLGCLFGLVVGNALGVPVEGWSADLIRKRYGILKDIYIIGFGSEGKTDDDCEMMLAIAESYIENRTCKIDDITKRFLKWFIEDGRGIGVQTRNVLCLIQSGLSPFDASYKVWVNSGQRSAGNGSLMRCVPTALARISEPDVLDFESREISRITHYDPRCTESCVFFNRLVSDMILGKNSNVNLLIDELRDETVKKHISCISNLSKDELKHGGYVIDTLSLALWFYLNRYDFEDSLIEIVNMGGDTDTNGAVAGALFGAQYGIDAIPKKWIDRLGNKERITNAATELFNLCFDQVKN